MFNGLLLKKKRTFYSSKVSELVGDRRALFRLIGDLMGTSERQIVPTRPCLLSVADDFSTFFASKIAALRLSLDSASDVSLPSDCAATDQSFLHGRGEQDLLLNFKSVSQDAVARLILDSPTKSCPLDPIPTHLLKRVPCSAPVHHLDCKHVHREWGLPGNHEARNCSANDQETIPGPRNTW